MSSPDWDPKWGPPPPPRPAVSAVEQARGRGAGPPSSLTVLLGLHLVSAVWTTATVYDRMAACAGIGLLLELALVYFLWAGRRWAWILAQIFAAFSLVGFAVLLLPAEVASAVGVLPRLKLLVDGTLGVASLWVLNTAAVREYVIGSRGKRRTE